jgi:hypothetical protein
LADIKDALYDQLLTYNFDTYIFAQLDHMTLKDHIQRVGLVFYP